jgi:hypothetical protein
MYALIEDGAVKQYPYGADLLRRNNPQISFPRDISEDLLAQYGVFPVKPSERPQFDPDTHRLQEATPARQKARHPDGTWKADDPDTLQNEAWEWVQVWNVTPLTEDELAQIQADHAEQVRQQRQSAYQAEADPLFFKWQRGQSTEQDWLDKIAEIKARYPD